MKAIVAYKAAPIGSETVQSVTLTIETIMPELDTLAHYAQVYEAEAEVIADALHASLPGGTYDHLLAKLMERRACTLRVNFPTYHDTVVQEAQS